MLTQEQLSQYRRDGYLVLPEFSAPEEAAKLKARGVELVADFDPQTIKSVFSTRNQVRDPGQWTKDKITVSSMPFCCCTCM